MSGHGDDIPPPPASPAPKGLPGFLRRSLRTPYEDGGADGGTVGSATPPPAAPGTPVLGGSSGPPQAGVGGKRGDGGGNVTPRSNEVVSSHASASIGGSAEGRVDDGRNKKGDDSGVRGQSFGKIPALPFGVGGDRGEANGAAATTGAGKSGAPTATGAGQASRSGSSGSRQRQTEGFDSNDGEDDAAPSTYLERTRSYKDIMFEKTISADVVNLRELRKQGWNGIPPEHRAQSWKILLGYLPTNAARREHSLQRKRAEYRDAIAQHYDIDDNSRTNQEQETLRQVLVDVPRTAPEVRLFHNDRVRKCLARLLYIWAMRHPASSYVQGINDLATPLIAVFLSGYYGGADVLSGEIMDEVPEEILEKVEADCYWCLTNLLAGIQDHYTSDQPGVQRMVMRLEELVTRIDADLAEHLRSRGIEFMQFAFKWMNCLLLREFNLRCVMRLWDTYFSEGDGGFEDFHVYVCAAFLCQFSAQVKSMEFDELFGFMQNMPTGDWGDPEVEILLSQAFVLSTLFEGSDAHLISQRH